MAPLRGRSALWLAAGATLALALGACASDDVGRRALAETITLRAELDALKQREDSNAREIARVQTQLRELEADATEKTREVRAAGVELARSRVLLEEARTELRERSAAPTPGPVAMPATPAAPPAASARAAGAPSSGSTPPGRPAPAPAPPPAAPAEAPGGAARSARSAEQLFSSAMANFRAHELGQAVLELTDLITRFPDHALAASAQVWIGEAYYQHRDYRQSLVEFRRVLDTYPKSPLVADALLKTGLCHRALGDSAAARTSWERVVREHSSSAAAGQARSLLGTQESAARSGR
jgi:tol-pal system protein YbgF